MAGRAIKGGGVGLGTKGKEGLTTATGLTMDAAQLVQVEALCETLYNSTDEAARSHAQNQLLSLQTSAERIPQCQYILDHSENAYALLLASSSLTRLISSHWNNFTSPQRVEIRNYILNYLGSVGPGLTDYVRTSLIQLLCRITKLGWFDDQRHREVVDAVMRFLQVCMYSFCFLCIRTSGDMFCSVLPLQQQWLCERGFVWVDGVAIEPTWVLSLLKARLLCVCTP